MEFQSWWVFPFYKCVDCGSTSPMRNTPEEAYAAATKRANSGWISAKDRRPEPWETELVWSKGDGYEIMMYDVDTDGWLSEERGCQSFNNFPYWQPLPEPPKEGEEKTT